jgi:uncharacterized protein
MSSSPLTLRFLDSIAEVDAQQWNALAGSDYPFLRHEFLRALEESGCVSAGAGWQARHLLVTCDGVPNACMPLYLKHNSMGEYVFDWSWADAYARHGLDYYPKLVTSIPFTPCAGPRLALAPGVVLNDVLPAVVAEVKELAARHALSSWHILFPQDELRDALGAAGLQLRAGCQYQWFNSGYGDFDAFLATFSSRKRKNLKKERAQVAAQGITFEVLEGAAIGTAHWRDFFRFYESTYFVRGRAPYLNLAFFEKLGALMPERLLLVLALHARRHVAGALFFKGADTLFGRYWGCTEEFRFLHFETCYYQGIDYCIRHELQRFDSGAQGEHKIQRGFKPVHTWSCHWLRHPDFARAVARFVQDERRHVDAYVTQARDYLPFRRDLEI